MNPRVTVAMPVFDAERTVREAVESVLFHDHGDLELIVVDDGSRDGSWREVQAFARDPRVVLLRNERRRGSGATRNRILELARGELFLPCDADDVLLPGAVRHLRRYLRQHPQVGVAFGDLLQLDGAADGSVAPPFVVGRDPSTVWDLLQNCVNHGGSLMRTELVRRVGGYEEGEFPDDWGLFLKLADVTAIHHVPGRLTYVWRREPTSQSLREVPTEVHERVFRRTAARRAAGVPESWLGGDGGPGS